MRIRERVGMVDIELAQKYSRTHLDFNQPLHRVVIEHVFFVVGVLITWLIDPVPQYIKVGCRDN